MVVQLFNETYDYIESYKDVYVVTRNDKYGIVNKADGSVVIPMEYEALIPVSEKIIIAEKNGKYGVIDFNESVVLPFEYDSIRPIEITKLFFFKEIKLFTKKGDMYKSYKLNELESGNYDRKEV